MHSQECPIVEKRQRACQRRWIPGFPAIDVWERRINRKRRSDRDEVKTRRIECTHTLVSELHCRIVSVLNTFPLLSHGAGYERQTASQGLRCASGDPSAARMDSLVQRRLVRCRHGW